MHLSQASYGSHMLHLYFNESFWEVLLGNISLFHLWIPGPFGPQLWVCRPWIFLSGLENEESTPYVSSIHTSACTSKVGNSSEA